MDLNYLFHRQQVERFRAERATSNEACAAHARLAALYESSIERMTEGRIRIASFEHPTARPVRRELAETPPLPRTGKA